MVAIYEVLRSHEEIDWAISSSVLSEGASPLRKKTGLAYYP